MSESEVTIFGFSLSSALPKVSEEILTALKVKLIDDLGVSELAELKYVEEKDIIDILKPIQARSLIRSFQSDNIQVEAIPAFKQPDIPAIPVNVPGSNAVKLAGTTTSTPNIDARWAENFEVDYTSVNKDAMKALNKNKRPHPRLQREFVRNVADAVQKVCQRPLRRDCLIICRKIVSKFPCLADSFCEENVGMGCESLLSKIVARCQNENRPQNYENQQKISSEDVDDPKEMKKSTKKKRPHSYGASNSCPDLPEEETEETQLQKQEEMKRMHSEEHKTYNIERANALLNATFYLQRKYLNLQKPVDFFILEWPLLLTKEGIFNHFRNLVGVDAEKKFQDSFERKTERILSVLEKKEFKDIQPSCLIILLDSLTKYFDEKRDLIMIEADSLVSKNEVEQLKHLPKTPCVISCGNARTAETFMLSLDSVVINETSSSLWDCFLMMIACYFNFNIMYPEEACATLEFIQRCYLGINPDRGNKRPKNHGKHVVHPKVLKLIDKISTFEWL